MKILICLKQVPAKDSPPRIHGDSTWIREDDLSYEINEPDSYALEEALQLKEKHGGEVVVCSVGPARVQQVIREALAKGADRAIHIEDNSRSKADSLFTARIMAEAVRPESFDLILTGLQSDDLGLGQTGVILAELLGMPHATIIMEVQVPDGHLSGQFKVKRELEGGWFQWVEIPLPALLTIQSGINKPRYATLKGIKAARTKEIRHLTTEQLQLKPTDILEGQRLRRVYVPTKTKKTEFLEGSPQEVATKLVERLQREVRLL
ncbi:MAG: electron transfer flavoprotein subunit beta/FixA family protein [Acidobacteria bacterium]|nr:electron transfer flavoprotein subunit beta/FixA family protein [Acidobacteriota bacterium]